MFSAWDADAYPSIFQGFLKPVGVVSAIPEQPFDIRQAAEQCPRTDIVTDLTGGDEQVERPPLAVAYGVQFRAHAAFGSTDQTTTPLFGGQAGRRSMSLQVGRVDHRGLLFGMLGGKTRHYARKEVILL